MDSKRRTLALQQIEGKRPMYKQPIAADGKIDPAH
jgi:hypothetical protein